MIRRNLQNRKAYVNLSCPGCGMALDDRKTIGFVSGNQTYCCEGCATGTGCTCRSIRIPKHKAGQKPGHMGQRNAENSPHDRNFNQEIDTSGRTIGRRKETQSVPDRHQSRVPHVTAPPKKKTSATKPRDSMREQARGRSEFVKRISRATRVDRPSRTGTKSK